MKELTIEEKAKRYDKATKIIKANLGALNDITEMGEKVVNIQPIKNCFYRAFPELIEGEDERIKGAIIDHLKDNNLTEWAVWLEKQGEQKPTDKAEPKFHEGDWIVFNGLALYIKEVVKGYYRTISKGGTINSYDWDIDNVARLWTIQEAKDGDVLATKEGNPFIYDKNRYNNGLAYYYAGLNANKELTLKRPRHMLGHFGELRSVFPATKEQRDTLMKAMADAGYTFDFEKKELKKIEQKPVSITDEWIEDYWQHKKVNNPYSYDKGEEIQFDHQGFVRFCKKYCKSPAEWSEEDQRILKEISHYCFSHTDNAEWYNWLISLKDKVQPQSKQEWSEEDEEMRIKILEALSAYADHVQDTGFCINAELIRSELMGWLKSLRPQQQRKSSDFWKKSTLPNDYNIKFEKQSKDD